jgi:hypothetical protein
MVLQTLHQGLQTFVDVCRQLRVVPEQVDRVLGVSQEYTYIINEKYLFIYFIYLLFKIFEYPIVICDSNPLVA